MKRLVCDDDFRADATSAGQQVRKLILCCERALQVFFRDQPNAQRRFAKPQPLRLLQLQHPLDVPQAEFALFCEYGADAAVLARDDAAGPFDWQNVFLGFHRDSSARARQSTSRVTRAPDQGVCSGLPCVEHAN